MTISNAVNSLQQQTVPLNQPTCLCRSPRPAGGDLGHSWRLTLPHWDLDPHSDVRARLGDCRDGARTTSVGEL